MNKKKLKINLLTKCTYEKPRFSMSNFWLPESLSYIHIFTHGIIDHSSKYASFLVWESWAQLPSEFLVLLLYAEYIHFARFIKKKKKKKKIEFAKKIKTQEGIYFADICAPIGKWPTFFSGNCIETKNVTSLFYIWSKPCYSKKWQNVITKTVRILLWCHTSVNIELLDVQTEEVIPVCSVGFYRI